MPSKPQGGVSKGKGKQPRGDGSGRLFLPLPESTSRLLEEARKAHKVVVHPALVLSKFVGWEEDGKEPKKDRAYENVLDELKKSEAAAQAHAWRRRRAAWLTSLGDRARRIEVEAMSPCVLWLGTPTPLELGFCLHHTYGLPYLPASSLKGLARAAMLRDISGVPVVATKEAAAAHEGDQPSDDPEQVLELFGKGGDRGHAGRVDFLDGIPLQANCLELEVMSPHHPAYYQDKSDIPHDCEDPIPLFFLRILPHSRFEIALVARETSNLEGSLELAQKYLLLGLAELGIGAKTTSGYGLFHRAGTSTPQPKESAEKDTPAIGQSLSTAERREIRGVTIHKFDPHADVLVFQDQHGNHFEASIADCERRFCINRKALNQLRKAGVRFRIEVVGNQVMGVYKE